MSGKKRTPKRGATPTSRKMECERNPPQSDIGYDGKKPMIVEMKDNKAEDGSRNVLPRNVNHCPLDWLYHRKHISDLQYNVGRRLRDDYARAGLDTMASTATALYGGTGSGGRCEPSDAKIDASQRLKAATAILAPRAKQVTELVVLAEISLAQAAKLAGIHDKAAMELLRDSLDLLARYYGLAGKGRQTGKIEVWLHPYNADV